MAPAFLWVVLLVVARPNDELIDLESIPAGLMRIIVANVATIKRDFVCRRNPQEVAFALRGLVPRGDLSRGDAIPVDRGPDATPDLVGVHDDML